MLPARNILQFEPFAQGNSQTETRFRRATPNISNICPTWQEKSSLNSSVSAFTGQGYHDASGARRQELECKLAESARLCCGLDRHQCSNSGFIFVEGTPHPRHIAAQGVCVCLVGWGRGVTQRRTTRAGVPPAACRCRRPGNLRPGPRPRVCDCAGHDPAAPGPRSPAVARLHRTRAPALGRGLPWAGRPPSGRGVQQGGCPRPRACPWVGGSRRCPPSPPCPVVFFRWFHSCRFRSFEKNWGRRSDTARMSTGSCAP